MDATHLHLILNHFPIVGTLIGTLILLWGVFRKNPGIQQAALAVIVVMAVLAIPVMLTGEPAEERVENITGVTETAIEAHEEAAELAIWAMEATGVLALLGLVLGWRSNRAAQPVVLLTLLLSFISFGLMARTGNLGGKIRHTELVTGTITSANAGENGAGTETGQGEKEEEEDD